MNLEKNFSLHHEKKEEPKINIKRSSEAPDKVKENPFYDPDFWGKALPPENSNNGNYEVYLPDNDEAFSFGIAAHEIGHLSKKDEIDENTIGLDNFEITKKEEERAWRIGKKHLTKYIGEYCKNNEEATLKILDSINKVEEGLMDLTEFSSEMYLEKGSLDSMNNKEIEDILTKKREKFFSEKEEEFKEKVRKIKKVKVGKKTNWEEFNIVVKKALAEIIEDNKKFE